QSEQSEFRRGARLAQSLDFDGLMVDGKSARRSLATDGHVDFRAADFSSAPAAPADEKFGRLAPMIDGAADEGILRFDLVYQTGFEQEVQCPVDRRRRRTVPFATDGRQQIISLGRAMVRPQQFEYTP